MIYLDTSALLKLYVREPDSAEVQKLVVGQDHPLPVWDYQHAELINALRLKVFWKELAEDDAERQVELFNERLARGQYYYPDLDRAAVAAGFRELSRETARLGCRTMDVLHVACARELKPTLFVSFDRCQRDLAQFAGLPLQSVSAD